MARGAQVGGLGNSTGLGDRIKERREAAGRSQAWLAKELGVNRSTIFRYEKGDTKKISLSTLEKLSDLLNTTKDYLFYGKDGNPFIEPVLSRQRIREMERLRSPVPNYGRTIRESLLNKGMLDIISKEERFYLIMESDAFAPRILSEDKLTVAITDELKNKAINVLLSTDGEVMLRRVMCDGNFVTFTVDNKSIFPEIYDLETVAISFRVIGFVEKIEASNP